jgi:uncharacterized cofD-like protein
MSARVVVLGGGHGVAAVLTALRRLETDLTVIVTVADDGGSSGELRRKWGSPAVGDMRRSLIALMGEKAVLARALAAPVTIARFGRHPLGNLLLCSLTRAFGDLQTASAWWTRELGLSARVFPATTEQVTLIAEAEGQLIRGESAIGAALGRIDGLGFDPQRPDVPPSALEAIVQADWVLLGPGSLFTSVLAVCALPAVTSALAVTPANVLWLCNLEPQYPETAGMSAADHLAALRHHNVRVDTVLYDPAAPLHFTRPELGAADLPGLAYPLLGRPGRHDSVLLSAALQQLFASGHVPRAARRSPPELFSATRPMGPEGRPCDIRIGHATVHGFTR